MKYKVIKSISQYKRYCKQLEVLLEGKSKSMAVRDEIELLTLLIRTWDEWHDPPQEMDPVQLLKSCMKDQDLKARDLAVLLEVSKSYISEIMNYKKAMSKDMIRVLSSTFKLRQEAFNRPYPLTGKTSIRVSATA